MVVRFVSDLFEGDINDVEIFKESAVLRHIDPNDILLVDRGFTVRTWSIHFKQT